MSNFSKDFSLHWGVFTLRPKCLPAFLIVIIFFILLLTCYPGIEKRRSEAQIEEDGEVINLFLVQCWRDHKYIERAEERRRFLEQTNTLVKTLIFFSSRPLNFYILTNDDSMFVDIKDAAAQFNSSQPVRFYSVDVVYPAGLEDMIGAFKFCATARLFLQDMLPDVDSGIFLDNDMLVLQDPAILWDRFKLFTPFTAMAVAPVEAHYSREMRDSVPYFGVPGLGINAGLALMNLTRLRDLPGGGFTEISRFIWQKYRLKLKLADQDVLNIVGAQAPWLLQPLPCQWNYHTWTCRPARFESQFISRMKWSGRNMCPKAAKHGIGFLHGNCQAFSDQGANTGCNGDATLRSVFNFWRDQDLNKMDLHRRLAELTDRIDQAVLGDNTSDSCARVKGLRDMVVRGFKEKVKALQA